MSRDKVRGMEASSCGVGMKFVDITFFWGEIVRFENFANVSKHSYVVGMSSRVLSRIAESSAKMQWLASRG